MTRSRNLMPWRILTHDRGTTERAVTIENAGEFDEVVLGDWLHVEQMSTTHYWMRLGDADINVTIDRRTGRAKRITLDPGWQDGKVKVEIR